MSRVCGGINYALYKNVVGTTVL